MKSIKDIKKFSINTKFTDLLTAPIIISENINYIFHIRNSDEIRIEINNTTRKVSNISYNFDMNNKKEYYILNIICIIIGDDKYLFPKQTMLVDIYKIINYFINMINDFKYYDFDNDIEKLLLKYKQ